MSYAAYGLEQDSAKKLPSHAGWEQIVILHSKNLATMIRQDGTSHTYQLLLTYHVNLRTRDILPLFLRDLVKSMLSPFRRSAFRCKADSRDVLTPSGLALGCASSFVYNSTYLP